MKFIKVAGANLNQIPRDWKGNQSRILKAIEMAVADGVKLLCLPELCITGYGLEDDFFCNNVAERAIDSLIQITYKMRAGIVVSVGLPFRFNNSLYNAVATITKNDILGLTFKQHLAGDGIHYENRWFKPWPQGVVNKVTLVTTKSHYHSIVPIGDIHFNIGGVKVGYEICEDAWVAGRPGNILSSKGVDIYLNPSASHFSFGKLETRKNFVVDGSRAFNATYVYTNIVGNESGRAIYDGGTIIASGGNLLALGKRFTFQDVCLTSAWVDVDTTRTQSARSASFQPNIEDCDKGCVVSGHNLFTYNTNENKINVVKQEDWEISTNLKHEECTRALSLALLDYMRKSHTKGFVVSLSGGCDSAMVTYLCATAIKLAVEELGEDVFIERYCPSLKGMPITRNTLSRALIITAYQSTENSGNVTKTAAAELANSLKTTHYQFDVQKIFEEYQKLGETIQGKPLNFEDNDVTLQNLQARTRSPSIWILANMTGKALLTTSNMSEAAVGYATMDGDTSGSVAPIAGLSKVYIREYLEWVTNYGPKGIGPCMAMHRVIDQQPTAELRPAEYKQTDEDDLMPYWLLHEIQKLFVKNRYTPVEIYLYLKNTIQYDNNQLIKDITKFFRLFSMNQWKRERYALSFHMDDHNLDPRTWCRAPILNAGYEEELEELKGLMV